MMWFYRNISFRKTQLNAKIRCKNNNTFQDTLIRQTFAFAFTSGINRIQCRLFKTYYIRIVFELYWIYVLHNIMQYKLTK